MRLKNIEQMLPDQQTSDVIRILMYRPEIFGGPFSRGVQDILRGVSDWSVEERELIGAFVSYVNQCYYCMTQHGAIASQRMNEATVQAVLTDWRTAPIRPQLQVVLAFLEKLIRKPTQINSDDIALLRHADLNDQEIEDAIYISIYFQIINRLVNSFDVAIPSKEQFVLGAMYLLVHGYHES